MKKEIERKFLVTGDDFKLASVSCVHIVQGYICRESGRTVRVRLEGEKGLLTIKGRSSEDGTNRNEWEYEIPVADAKAMLSLCTGKLIMKDRYVVPVGHIGSAVRSASPIFDDGLIWEVDVFHGAHEGLVLAEIELRGITLGDEFGTEIWERMSLPSWIGEEVTGDRRYYNSVLSAE